VRGNSVSFEADSRVRSKFGVVVSLVELDDGTTRVVLDDVKSAAPMRETAWTFDCFYTHKNLDSKALQAMGLPDSEYQGLGEALLARLLALNESASSE
jgi:hypothetical protein